MCSIDRQVVVSMEGVSWKVKQSLITTINGVDFVKLPATDVGFVKLVCGKAVPDKVPKMHRWLGCLLSGAAALLPMSTR